MSSRLVRRISSVTAVTIPVLFSSLSYPLFAQGPPPRAVALTGTDGPLGPGLGPGVVFQDVLAATLNNAGDIAFLASLDGEGVTGEDNESVFKISPKNGTVLVARESQDASLPLDARFIGFQPPILSDAGDVGFVGNVLVPGEPSGRRGVFTGNGTGVIATAAMTGLDDEYGPGLGPGVVFDDIPGSFSDDLAPFSSQGQFTFRATVAGAEITEQNQWGVWRSNEAGHVSPIARTGTDGLLGPGLGPGIQFIGFVDTPFINGSGDVTFQGGIAGEGVDDSNNSGIWLIAVDHLPKILARTGVEGALGPQLPGAFVNAASPLINEQGDIVFVGTMGDATQGYWHVTSDQSPQPLFLSGTDGPLGPGLGAETVFDGFTIARLNNTGGVGFTALVSGPGVPPGQDRGVWLHDHAAPELVAMSGLLNASLVEGLDPNLQITSVGDFVHTPWGMLLGITLAGPGVSPFTNGSAVVSWVDGEYRLLFRRGDMIDVDPTAGEDLRQLRTADLIQFPSRATGGDGMPRAFDDHGLVTYQFVFQDGSRGIFTINVPEPSSFLLALIAVAVLLTAKRFSPLA